MLTKEEQWEDPVCRCLQVCVCVCVCVRLFRHSNRGLITKGTMSPVGQSLCVCSRTLLLFVCVCVCVCVVVDDHIIADNSR